MAILIKTDGAHIRISPKNGKKFVLEELQQFVGGDIELIKALDGRWMYVNEEGRLKNLLPNFYASLLCSRLIVGDVVVCEPRTMYR